MRHVKNSGSDSRCRRPILQTPSSTLKYLQQCIISDLYSIVTTAMTIMLTIMTVNMTDDGSRESSDDSSVLLLKRFLKEQSAEFESSTSNPQKGISVSNATNADKHDVYWTQGRC